ncbi:MAG: RNA methyltransferase [Candidatus Tectomicrobia bacterium]|uniref:tRNA (cytidine/uridine-2'-O-)-methyltransferase TrmJ n=1 Tax=Tectimicrobiota bacterium TaxID=2528274 RepID=A0A932FWM3_UNCTE|nr:RNA methyltransferase [Candidatus Tectomicrobia bacterium]
MSKPISKRPEPVVAFAPPPNLAHISVILVGPAIPGNIGASARAMKTMGLADLVILNGAGFREDEEALRMAHGARDLLERARVVSTWEEATAGLHWLVGTTHRRRRGRFAQWIAAREAARKVAELSQAHRVGIVFGREESGLTDAELRCCQTIATVPSAAAHPSLNLAQAVMLFSYEIFQESLGDVPRPPYDLATIQEVESALEHLSDALQKIGFLPHQADPDSFLRVVRRLFSRAPLESRDCNVLHRICQQIDDFARRGSSREPDGWGSSDRGKVGEKGTS